MKRLLLFKISMLVLLVIPGLAGAESTGVRQDQKAVDVLQKMSAYTASLDKLVIRAEVFVDTRLEAGLMASDPAEVEISVDRPGSLFVSRFDGLNTKEIYLHEGMLTVFRSDKGYYARASVPDDIEEGMRESLEKFEVETPLGDLIFSDAGLHMLSGDESVLYLASKSRIRGVDCHHIALRGPEADVQLWIEEGDRPVPRKMILNMKWEGGSPRHTAFLEWAPKDALPDGIFDFKPPEGSIEIGFVGARP